MLMMMMMMIIIIIMMMMIDEGGIMYTRNAMNVYSYFIFYDVM